MEKTAISLTQFIDFTIKGSAAKTKMVKDIKYQDDYHPARDYWKPLRTAIVKFHKENSGPSIFENLISDIDPKKKSNYIEAIKQYQKFLKGKQITWFDPGKAFWSSDELTVRSSSELGLIINDSPHLVKLYFKGKNEKVDQRNISTTLVLQKTSTYDKADEVSHAVCSVLNIQKNRLHSDLELTPDRLIALKSEAAQFMYIWKQI